MYGDRPPRQDHDVVCAECGQQTTVPFKPSGNRPVLCRDCFAKNRPPRREGGGGGGFGGPRSGGGDRGDRPSFDATCTRCGAATTVPFKPTPGRPVLCRDCFRSSRQ